MQVSSNELEAEVVAFGTGPFTYKWSNGVGDLSRITVDESGTYSVTVTDLANQCNKEAYFNYIEGVETACGTDSKVTDADGNEYNVVAIGNQCWMTSNLKVSAGIPHVTDSATWVTTTSPAWCFYNNNPANASFGKLYNWYAVESGNLCPAGWHISTFADWQELENFAGAEPAGHLKSVTGWDSPNTGATDSYGFNALPAGYRSYLGSTFIGFGQTAGFWTSTPASSSKANFRALTYDSAWLTTLSASKNQGYSCRCVKD